MADTYNPLHPHGQLELRFPDIWQVMGSIQMKPIFRFSRNMTVLRHETELTLVNPVRLDEEGLAALEALGEVRHVIKLGSFHGYDDRFYVERYKARYYVLSGDRPSRGIPEAEALSEDSALPIPDASLFLFHTAKKPEGLLRLDRDGGILLSCDALQNWEGPDAHTNLVGGLVMRVMGFFTPANVGPAWAKTFEPQAEDFRRLLELEFNHVLPAHGGPVLGDAKAKFTPAIQRYIR